MCEKIGEKSVRKDICSMYNMALDEMDHEVLEEWRKECLMCFGNSEREYIINNFFDKVGSQII